MNELVKGHLEEHLVKDPSFWAPRKEDALLLEHRALSVLWALL